MSELSHLGAYRLIHQSRLTDAEEHALNVHLRECAACREHAIMAGVLYRDFVLMTSTTRPSPQLTAVYMESAARRSRRSHIMKPIYAVGGAVALVLLMLAGWFIIRSNIQTTGLVEAPQLPPISISESQVEEQPAAPEEAVSQPEIDVSAVNQQLIAAVEAGDAAEVQQLLNSGADPDYVAGDGVVALPLAAAVGQLEIVQLLLEAGADVNSTMDGKISSGNTFTEGSPLFHAASAGHLDVVELLLANNADPNKAVTTVGLVPLHESAWFNHVEIIETLLANGAQPDVRGTRGDTPLQWAAMGGAVEAAEMLLEAGADVNNIDMEQGLTPLLQSLMHPPMGPPELINLLLDHGADPDVQDKFGNAALYYAASAEDGDIVEILLERGASVDMQNNGGSTALHRAAHGNRAAVVRVLIEHGASLDIVDNKGQTPLDVAANEQIAGLLREAGAESAETQPAAQTEGYSLLETIPSPSLSGAIFGSDEEQAAVYLPASYDSSENRYPVLYILGSLSDFFFEGAEVQSESLGWKMNAALGGGPSKEMIIVVPDSANSVGWGRAVSDGPVNGNVLAFIAEDVVDYVDANYRTIPEPAARGLLGLDISGHDALNLVLNYPDRFGALFLNHPWLLAPGGLEESRFAGPVARVKVVEFIDELSALPREDAHARLLEILEENPVMYDAGLTMTYGWDYVADDELNAPYFEYIYLDENTPAGEQVWQRWEEGIGKLDQKVVDNADSLRSLNAIGVSEALNEQAEPWAADGIHYLVEQFEANALPFQMHTYEGTIEDIYEQLKNPILPFFSDNLVFEE